MALDNHDKEEELLWRIWYPEYLYEYIGKWIAFKGEVIASSEDLNILSERFVEEIERGDGPIFAFVTFEARA